MVGMKDTVTRMRLFLAVLLVLALLAAFASPALADQDTEQEPTILEEQSASIDGVGDLHVESKIKYRPDDYKMISQVVKKNPKYLSRRYVADSNIGEADNFEAKLDNATNSITISFDTPGYAYCLGDNWEIYGIPVKPKALGNNKYRYEVSYLQNNEFTMFTEQSMKTVATIQFPPQARNISFKSDGKAMKYTVPAPGSKMGFFSDNRTLLAVLFGVLALVFAVLLLLVARRKLATESATAGAPAAPSARPSGLEASPPPEARAAAPPASAGPAREEAEKSTREETQAKVKFCRRCGAELVPGQKFCSKCGTKM